MIAAVIASTLTAGVAVVVAIRAMGREAEARRGKRLAEQRLDWCNALMRKHLGTANNLLDRFERDLEWHRSTNA